MEKWGCGPAVVAVRALTEAWPVPADVAAAPCRVMVAGHCHTPLGELWRRLPAPKFCVSLPCCGDCGALEGVAPILSYRDTEVLSEKNTVHLYAQLA